MMYMHEGKPQGMTMKDHVYKYSNIPKQSGKRFAHTSKERYNVLF